MSEKVPFLRESIAEVADKTVEMLYTAVNEIPHLTSVDDAVEFFLKGDRKIYSGILLGIIALLLMMFLD